MSKRILIAEDDDLQGAMLRSALQGRGYEAEIVTGGLEAVRRLRTGHFDLALLDYHMPEVDGLAAARLMHDFVGDDDRPRLIAITAATEGLQEKEAISGEKSFDAVVSKQLGLPALIRVVETNLMRASERSTALLLQRRQLARREAAARRRRRLLSPFAALPALAMAAAFAAAFGWATMSLSHLDSAMGLALRTDALSTDTAGLIDALHDAEISQRTFLATGAEAHREMFETDAQRVDQMLAAATPMDADGMPGFGTTTAPQTVIDARLRKLADEAAARGDTGPAAAAVDAGAGRDASEWLRRWASGVVSGSVQLLSSALDAVRRNVEFVLGVLAVGVIYGLWNAFRAVQRRWPDPRPAANEAMEHMIFPALRPTLNGPGPSPPVLLLDSGSHRAD